MARFCSKCGSPADAGTRFCQKCGNALDAPATPPVTPPVTPAVTPAASAVPEPVLSQPAPVPAAAPATGQTPQKSGGGCGKVLLIVAGVIVVLVLLGIAGAAYVAYRAKKKIDEVHEAIKTNDAEKLVEALGGKAAPGGHANQSLPVYPELGAGAAAPVAGAPGAAEPSLGTVVPLRKGLRIVTAIQQYGGDYESIKEITGVTDEAVLMNYSADHIPDPGNPFDKEQQNRPPRPGRQSVHTQRRILREDLQNAREYEEMFSPAAPLTFPGTTALGVSAAVLNGVKGGSEVPFTYHQGGMKGALGNLLGGLGGLTAGQQDMPKESRDAMEEMKKLAKVNCPMKRADQKTYAFPVLVNGQRRELPAIRATCVSEGDTADFYFLDDPENALALTWKLGANDRLQVVKIEYTETRVEGAPAAPSEIERKLEEQQPAVVYGIYFDFASAEIRPQSKPTLDEIAGILRAHPDWKLSVSGHTDNVGGDAFNAELSKKRAEAVKQALALDYHVAAGRLTTAGYGASSPVDTNETMEGRARNRRVELARQ